MQKEVQARNMEEITKETEDNPKVGGILRPERKSRGRVSGGGSRRAVEDRREEIDQRTGRAELIIQLFIRSPCNLLFELQKLIQLCLTYQ